MNDKFHMNDWGKDHIITDFLMREKVAIRGTKAFKNVPCNVELFFQICQNIQDTGKFEGADGNRYKT